MHLQQKDYSRYSDKTITYALTLHAADVTTSGADGNVSGHEYSSILNFKCIIILAYIFEISTTNN